MTQSIEKYKGPVEISVVVTPWESEYLVVNHINPEPVENTKSKFHEEICNYLNNGKEVFSLGKSNTPIMENFPKWLKAQPDLEIRAGQTRPFMGWNTDGGLVKELFSEEYLTKRGLEIKEFHEKLQNDPQISITVKSIEKYKQDVEFYINQIAFDQVIIDSAPKQACISERGSPSEMFFNENGLILSYAGIYDYRAGPVKLFKITDIDKTLKQSNGSFPHYSIFTQFPVNGYGKYLSPGECAFGDLDKLRDEKRLFNIKGNLMIVQPENSTSSLYSAIRD